MFIEELNEDLTGAKLDIWRGHKDDGTPIEMPAQRQESYRQYWRKLALQKKEEARKILLEEYKSKEAETIRVQQEILSHVPQLDQIRATIKEKKEEFTRNIENIMMGAGLDQPPGPDPDKYYESSAIGGGCKQSAFIKVTGSGPEAGIYAGKVQQYLTDFGGWQDFSDCYIREANGASLETDKKYIAIRYENYSDNTPMFSTITISESTPPSYTPSNPANWSGSPFSLNNAIDRLASAVAGLLGTPVP